MMPFDLTAATREIDHRNQLRRDVGLPLLDRDLELEKLWELHRERDFQDYIEQHRALYNRALRRAASNYQRRTGMLPRGVVSGFAVGAGVMRMFRRRYEAERI